jgi:uncharacterized membrane protein
LAYPGIVYATRGIAPPSAFVIVALAVIGLRLATLRSPASRIWRAPLAGVILIIAAAAMVDTMTAAKAYPSVVSLMTAAAFGTTLFYPPSLIERIVRSREPDLPLEASSYCRKVTIVWTVWLSANAVVAAILAVRGSDEAWALWTGLLAYVMMGVLFIGEVAVRHFVRLQAAKR